ncbi:hypothetical protein [Microbacterium oxydans]|uniref:hypothetical protein n=1 Tax=Microbacterium oxydans TaxID=82380 RepID=UPI0037C7F9FE
MAAMTPIRTIEISGAPRERGRRYGEAAADLIAGSIEYYTEALTQQTGMSWAGITDRGGGGCRLRRDRHAERAR